MKVNVAIHLTDDFNTACQIYNIRLMDALKCYADNVIIYEAFSEMHDEHASFASRIFFENYLSRLIWDKDRNLKCAHQQSNKDGVIQVLKLMAEGAGSRSRKYRAAVKEWKNSLKLYFMDLPPLRKKSEVQNGMVNLKINLSDDFIILCHFIGFSPSHALQFFIDRLSLPKLLSKDPDAGYSDVTRFFFINIRVSHGKEIRDEISKRSSKCYEEELTAYLKRRRSRNQPKLEALIRKKIEAWRKEYLTIMNQLKNEGYDIEIINNSK